MKKKKMKKMDGENGVCVRMPTSECEDASFSLGEYHVTCNPFGGKKAYSCKQARTGTTNKGLLHVCNR